jgi:molybdate transport system regulatory protein
MITNNSLEQLALKEGKLVTAEIKAPWIMIQKGKDPPASSADNQFAGTIERINAGAVSTEYSLRISDGTVLCAVISAESARELTLKVNDPAWAIFNCFSVVLNVD